LSSSAFQVYSSVNFEPRCDLHFAMTGCFFHTADVTEIFMMRFKMLSLLVFWVLLNICFGCYKAIVNVIDW